MSARYRYYNSADDAAYAVGVLTAFGMACRVTGTTVDSDAGPIEQWEVMITHLGPLVLPEPYEPWIDSPTWEQRRNRDAY